MESFQPASRFNGLPARGKPLKRFEKIVAEVTGLKPVSMKPPSSDAFETVLAAAK